jgi:periodic tryptophan protein 2
VKVYLVIMNQRGSYYEVSCVDFSKDGLIIATGGLEGTLKLWDSKSYFCFSSTSEHESKITAIKFSPKKNNTVLTASLDGTVRGFDAKRYNYFRVMRPDVNNQLLCLEVDPSGDVFSFYLRSLSQEVKILTTSTVGTSRLETLSMSSQATRVL